MSAHVAVVPAAMMLFLLVVQVSLWFYGRSLATAAAQHGLDAARAETGSAAQGEATAQSFIGQTGGLADIDVDVARSEVEVTVTVDADPLQVLPYFEVPIHVELQAPVERVVE